MSTNILALLQDADAPLEPMFTVLIIKTKINYNAKPAIFYQKPKSEN